ncbi:hypothetical protein SK128_026824 [Halocaridina rubra]|uniref:Uncharacterized protein n=1 Tax=Halocaridina rubra TaxID=373956 RepID=A0AAN8WAW3_HALRR
MDDELIGKNVRFVDNHVTSTVDGVDDSLPPSSLVSNSSSNDGSLVRRGSSRASSTYSGNKEREDSHGSVRKMTKQNLLAKQVCKHSLIYDQLDCYCSHGRSDQCLHCFFASREFPPRYGSMIVGAAPPRYSSTGTPSTMTWNSLCWNDAFIY